MGYIFVNIVSNMYVNSIYWYLVVCVTCIIPCCWMHRGQEEPRHPNRAHNSAPACRSYDVIETYGPEFDFPDARDYLAQRFEDIAAYMTHHGLQKDTPYSYASKELDKALLELEKEFRALQYRPRIEKDFLLDLESSALARFTPNGQQMTLGDGEKVGNGAVAVSADGGMVAWCSEKEKQLHILDPLTGQSRCSFDNKRLERLLEFSPQGKNLIAFSSEDKKIHLYKFSCHGWDFEEIDAGEDLGKAVTTVQWSPDGTAFACLHDKGISIWGTGSHSSKAVPLYTNTDAKGDFLTWAVFNRQLTLLCISSGGIATAYGPAADTTPRTWTGKATRDCDLLGNLTPWKSQNIGDTVTCIASQQLHKSRTRTRCAVALGDGSVRFVHGDGKPLDKPHDVTCEVVNEEAEPSTIETLAFSPDGSMLAGGGTDGDVQVWRNNGRGRMISFAKYSFSDEHDGKVTCLAWSPDSIRMAAGSSAGVAAVWSLFPLREEMVLWAEEKENSPFLSLQFYGRYLCVVCKNEPLEFRLTELSVPYDELGATWSARKF